MEPNILDKMEKRNERLDKCFKIGLIILVVAIISINIIVNFF